MSLQDAAPRYWFRILSDRNVDQFLSKPRINAVIDVVCKHYRVRRHQIIGVDRTDETTLARHVALYLAQRCSGRGSTFLQGIFNREHTTIRYGIARIRRMRDADQKFAALLDTLEKRAGEGG